MATRSTGSVLLFTAIAAASMIACSVTSTETPTGGTKNGTSSSSSSSGSSGSTTSSSSSGGEETTPTNAATCGAKSGYEACMDCCTGGKPEAVKAGQEAFRTCLCGTSGACKTECATDLCATDEANAQESQACADCLKNKGQSCIESADTACEADADCKAATACADAAKCEEKE